MTEQGKVSADKGGGPTLETRKERMTPIGLSTAKRSYWCCVCQELGLLDRGLIGNKGHSCHFVYDWC